MRYLITCSCFHHDAIIKDDANAKQIIDETINQKLVDHKKKETHQVVLSLKNQVHAYTERKAYFKNVTVATVGSEVSEQLIEDLDSVGINAVDPKYQQGFYSLVLEEDGISEDELEMAFQTFGDDEDAALLNETMFEQYEFMQSKFDQLDGR